MNNQVVKLDAPELSLIEDSKAAKIKATFEPLVIMLEGFEESYNEVIKEAQEAITLDVTAKAKRLRLDIGKVRIQTAKLKDSEKKEYQRAANAIQGVHNVIVWAVADKESKLKEIEEHFANLETERLSSLQLERVNLLSQYVPDAQERNLSSMEYDVWEAYLAAKKQSYADLLKAERQAEADRLAEIEAERKYRLRMEAENEKLRLEAAENERIAKIEADKREKEYHAREVAAKKEADRQEYEEKLRNDQARKENEARAAKEKEEQEARLLAAKAELDKRQAIEAKLAAKEQAEIEAVEQEAARVQSELNKGDEDKVADLKNDLTALKNKYSFDSVKNKTMYKSVGLLIDKLINHIN